MTEPENIERLASENEALKCRVEELTDFIENGSMPLHWVNGEGVVLWANQAELNLLGYQKEEYIGFPIQNFHADSAVIENLLNKLCNYETVQDFPARLKCKNGDIKYVSISSNVFQQDNKFIHTRCFTKDITELVLEEKRKSEYQQKLIENEERLRLAITASNLGTWDLNFKTGIMQISSEMQTMLGIDFDRDESGIILNYVYPEDRRAVNDFVLHLKTGMVAGPFDFVCRFLKSGTTMIWIKVQGTTYVNSDNEIQRMIGCVLDITDIKNSEEKNAKLVSIVNSSYDAIISKTLNGIISSWNGAAEEMFGYNAEEMLGQPILRIIPEDRLEEEDFILERMRAGEPINHFETKRITKVGKLLDVSLTISPIRNESGEITGISKIARDISEKKQEDRRKNDFVSMVSHELKTPITSILLCAQTMQRNLQNGSVDLRNKLAQRIEIQSKRMTSMIQDFLSLARIEEGKIQMHFEQFQLLGLIEEVIDEAKYISNKHILKVNCDHSFEILADRDKIGQVLTNLLSNAVKYSPQGGTVIVGCEKIDGRNISIYVIDQGMGISKSDQKKLFKRFFRVEREDISNISGFGIGLFIVAEVLHYHNSTIQVESKIGEGSKFHFILENKK
ncbi:MAG: PAS domain S-box protein [Sphingobacterium sp.]|jgi:PAS domain S-box-containing protein|nr:PAS domain S-box protein [Sphingobacterium sp.]